MERNITLTFSRKTQSIVIAKIIILVIISSLIGYFSWKDSVTKYQEGKRLTYSQYQRNYEKYKAEQTQKPDEIWIPIVVVNIMLFLLFGIYEALGHGLGLLIAKVNENQTSISN